jgi:hypothetical protein
MFSREKSTNIRTAVYQNWLKLRPLFRWAGVCLGSGWGALLFFGVATAVFTWPLVTHLSNTLPDWGDPADSAWRIGAIAHQLRTDPLHIYQTRAFYPLNQGLVLDELLTGQGLVAAPLIWLTDNPPLAFNVLLFTSFALSGFAMWLLVVYLTSSRAAGWVAGLIFAFSPWHYGQYAHLGLAAQQWMIFALYFLIQFTRATRPELKTRLLAPLNLRYLGLFSFFLILQALAAGYYAYFELILIGAYLLYYFIFESGLLVLSWRILRPGNSAVRLDGRRLGQQIGLIVVAGLLSVVVLLPLVMPFKHVQDQFTFQRDLAEISYWSAAPNSLLRTTPRSWLYKPVQRGIFNLKTSSERMLYPGLIALLLSGIGLFSLRKRSKLQPPESALGLAPPMRLRWLFAVLALSGLVLSFGPVLNLEAYGLNSTGITLPYKLLYDFLPGFAALRVPQRFGQLFMLGIAVCAGYGVAKLLRTKSASPNLAGNLKSKVSGLKRIILVLMLLALVTADYIAPDLPARITPTGPQAPPLYQWLAGSEADSLIAKNALVLELPIGNEKNNMVNTNPIYLMYGLSHDRPMLNGSANIIPPGYDRLFYEMQAFPQVECLDIIEGLGVQYLIVHTEGLANIGQRTELEQLAGPGGRLALLKSFETPQGFKDLLYRVRSHSKRFQRLSALIPEGAEVLLADHPHHRRLYTTALPGLIGPHRRYWATYSTIYSKMISKIRPAQPNRLYEYAIFYREDKLAPGNYGFEPADLVLNDAAFPIQIYHRAPPKTG